MRLYETLYIINPELAEEDHSSVVDKFSNLVEKSKGVIISVDDWGLKKPAEVIDFVTRLESLPFIEEGSTVLELSGGDFTWQGKQANFAAVYTGVDEQAFERISRGSVYGQVKDRVSGIYAEISRTTGIGLRNAYPTTRNDGKITGTFDFTREPGSTRPTLTLSRSS